MPPAAVTVAIAFHSGYGHTARQAAAVGTGVESVDGARADLRDVAILDDELWEALAAADAIVFGSPTYMGQRLGGVPGVRRGQRQGLGTAGLAGQAGRRIHQLGPEVAPPAADLATAEHLGRRVALTALEVASGRRSMATIMSATG